MIEIVETEYVNISVYSPLLGSTYIKLSSKLKNSINGLFNIKNNDKIFFPLCHIRHLSPLKMHPELITKANENMVNNLAYKGIEFPVSKKDFKKIEQKMCFVMKMV